MPVPLGEQARPYGSLRSPYESPRRGGLAHPELKISLNLKHERT